MEIERPALFGNFSVDLFFFFLRQRGNFSFSFFLFFFFFVRFEWIRENKLCNQGLKRGKILEEERISVKSNELERENKISNWDVLFNGTKFVSFKLTRVSVFTLSLVKSAIPKRDTRAQWNWSMHPRFHSRQIPRINYRPANLKLPLEQSATRSLCFTAIKLDDRARKVPRSHSVAERIRNFEPCHEFNTEEIGKLERGAGRCIELATHTTTQSAEPTFACQRRLTSRFVQITRGHAALIREIDVVATPA